MWDHKAQEWLVNSCLQQGILQYSRDNTIQHFNEGNNKVPELVAAQETDEIQLNQTGSKNYAGLWVI